jgi:hypothetical protein
LSIEIYQSLGLHTIRLWGVKPDGSCECGRNPCGNSNRSAGKHPLASGWQRQPTPDLYFPPPANVGIRCGRQPGGFAIVALDVDDSLAFGALQLSLPPLPPTLTTISGKGFHLLFRVPLELVGLLRNFVKKGGIDLRAEGGQVVAAPSRHYSGAVYQLANAEAGLAMLPEAWFAWLASNCRPREAAPEQTDCPFPRNATWLAEAIETVRSSPPDFPGSPGLTWRLAVKLVRGWLLPPELALQLLEAWNAQSKAPLPRERLADRIRGAETGSDLPWGFMRPMQGGGSLNVAQSPAELVAVAPPQLAGAPGLAPLPAQAPEFAPKPKRVKALTQEWLDQRACRKDQLAVSIKRLADGDAYSDAEEFVAALRALSQGSPVDVEWSVESIQEKLGRCWVGGPFDLADVWRKILDGKSASDLTSQGIALALATHPAWQGALGFDVLADRMVWKAPAPFTRLAQEAFCDHDFIGTMRWFTREFGREPAKGTVQDSVLEFAHTYCAFNPLTDYLDALAWDGVARCDGWLGRAFGAEDSPFNRLVASKWLISACARAYQPGVKVDHVITFQGLKQGEGKNMALEILAIKDDWYCVLGGDVSGKDSLENLRGKWIVVLDELAALRRSEKEAIKKFITTRVDTYRASYGRVTADYPRRCVFAATTNDFEFLDDGAERRWWPVAVQSLDEQWLRANRDQLWAEALHRFRQGEDWWKVPRDALDEAQVPFRRSDEIDDRLSNWLAALDRGDFTIGAASAGIGEPLDLASQGRLARALYRLGCKKLGPVVEGGVRSIRWRRG